MRPFLLELQLSPANTLRPVAAFPSSPQTDASFATRPNGRSLLISLGSRCNAGGP